MPVTPGPIRSKVCKRGHPLVKRGDRQRCLTCNRLMTAESRARKKAKQQAAGR